MNVKSGWCLHVRDKYAWQPFWGRFCGIFWLVQFNLKVHIQYLPLHALNQRQGIRWQARYNIRCILSFLQSHWIALQDRDPNRVHPHDAHVDILQLWHHSGDDLGAAALAHQQLWRRPPLRLQGHRGHSLPQGTLGGRSTGEAYSMLFVNNMSGIFPHFWLSYLCSVTS